MTVMERIEDALHRNDVQAHSWREGEDGLEAVVQGTWVVIDDDDERGLFGGDVGEVVCCVVGAEEFHNQRAIFTFTPEGHEGGEEVVLFDDVEPAP